QIGMKLSLRVVNQLCQFNAKDWDNQECLRRMLLLQHIKRKVSVIDLMYSRDETDCCEWESCTEPDVIYTPWNIKQRLLTSSALSIEVLRLQQSAQCLLTNL
ncbi:hypothetical protein L9F63_023456, partial [Diploptera punctata]